MPITSVNTDALVAEVTRAQGLDNSAVALINGTAAAIKTAVDAAILAEDASNQSVVDAANAAIAATVSTLTASDDAIAAALVTTPSPTPSPAIGKALVAAAAHVKK